MIRFCISLLFCVSFLISPAQIKKINIDQYEDHLEYLHEKLNYTYYNPGLENYWINKFDISSEDGKMYLKNTRVKDPRIMSGKKYIEKIFVMGDMNPYTIDKVHLDHTEGRMVEGEEIIIYTVKHQKLIRKTVNGVSGSSQSFLQISIPKNIESQTHITDTLIQIFKELILFKTTLHNLQNESKNMELIFETLRGDHVYENEKGQAKRFIKEETPAMILFEEYQDRQKLLDGSFGYDKVTDRYYEIIVSASGETSTVYYKLRESDQLVLESEDGKRQIFFPNKSLYYYLIEGKRTDFKTS